jgi:uncharacterized membrane protein
MAMRLGKAAGFKVVLGVAGIFFAIALVLTLNRHFTFYSSYDQGIFNQVFWNTVHGRWFESSLSSQLSTNVIHSEAAPAVDYRRLGQHFTPALLLWMPFYALWPHPATLTILQVSLVTAGGLVLYALARRYLEPPVAIAIAVSYYGANAVLGPTLGNFHDICQIPLFLFSLLLAMEKRQWWLFALFAALVLAVREDSAIALFGVGAYMVASRRFVPAGLTVCVGSVAYFLWVTAIAMPYFSADISRRFMLEVFGDYVEGNEASTVEVIGAMMRRPLVLLGELVSPIDSTVLYLLGHWLPLAFVPALSPAAWLVAGPPLLQLFAAGGSEVFSLNIRYALTVVPGMFYGAILWWAGQGFCRFRLPLASANVLPVKPRQLTPRWHRFWIGCLVLSTLTCLAYSPNRTLYFLLPDSYQPWVYVSLPEQVHHSQQIYTLLAQIPSEANVSASAYIVPHLSGRQGIVRFPTLQVQNDRQEEVDVEYAIADLWRRQRYQVAFDSDREFLGDEVEAIEEMTAKGLYGVVGFEEGVILLRRGVASKPEAVTDWQDFRQNVRREQQQLDAETGTALLPNVGVESGLAKPIEPTQDIDVSAHVG